MLGRTLANGTAHLETSFRKPIVRELAVTLRKEAVALRNE